MGRRKPRTEAQIKQVLLDAIVVRARRLARCIELNAPDCIILNDGRAVNELLRGCYDMYAGTEFRDKWLNILAKEGS